MYVPDRFPLNEIVVIFTNSFVQSLPRLRKIFNNVFFNFYTADLFHRDLARGPIVDKPWQIINYFPDLSRDFSLCISLYSIYWWSSRFSLSIEQSTIRSFIYQVSNAKNLPCTQFSDFLFESYVRKSDSMFRAELFISKARLTTMPFSD